MTTPRPENARAAAILPDEVASPPTGDELRELIAETALLRGEFTLRSGRTSNYYLDKYAFTTQPRVLSGLGLALADRIKHLEAGTDRSVMRLAGAELGGIPLVTAAGFYTGLPMIFVRNQKKEYGTAKQLEGKLHRGDRVVFVEDVATTAGQAIEAVEVLREAGADVLGVIAVIDREEGARENMDRAGIRFEALYTKTDLGVRD